MAKTTIDHQTIRKWVEARGGCPARVKRTGGGDDPGILRIDFPGYAGEQTLESVEWDEFFEKFDSNGLALIYQDRTRGGQPSRFSKLVKRETVGLSNDGGRRQRGRAAAGEQPTEEQGQDAISLLTSQHRMVEQMIEQLSATSPRSVEFRRTFEQLADALAIHATIEERIFYPAAKTDKTEELLEESVDDHLAVKRVLATMLETAPDGDILAELEELGGLTEEHVIEEEHELFPQVRRQMDAAELRELGARMNELTEQLRREGAPRLHVPDETEAPAPI
jgi:iron-sulfur cluster repair protein YtfE (RIC family)